MPTLLVGLDGLRHLIVTYAELAHRMAEQRLNEFLVTHGLAEGLLGFRRMDDPVTQVVVFHELAPDMVTEDAALASPAEQQVVSQGAVGRDA